MDQVRIPPASEMAAAVAILRQGELVAYPTETFYGLGGDAWNPRALERILALKGRAAVKGLSLLVDGPAMLAALGVQASERAHVLMNSHWPGPLTLALPCSGALPPELLVDGCLAVRVSSHPVAQSLVQAFGGPLTATSANRSGEAPFTTAAEVLGCWPHGLAVLDGGTTAGGSPSTLARVRGQQVEILRLGPVRLD